MSLTDENGVLLTKARNSDRIWPDMSVQIGDVWSEENVGCTAHNLALAYNRPVQIIGPVNFLKILDNNLSSAAPIFNEYGDTVGSIRLIQRNADTSRLMTHTLGWVTSVASAITNQLKLFRRDKRLQLMNSTLKAAFAHAEEGYISIDEAGYIVHINKEASRILNIKQERKKTNLYNLLEDWSPISNALESGRAIVSQPLHVKGDSPSILHADIEPFHGDRKKHAHGAILRLSAKADSTKVNPLQLSPAISFNSIIGKCSAIEALKDTARIVSQRPINILLLGESGTGKEVFAQAIHNSYNKTAPFIAINCASIPANLIESELFGYEGGSFTGADKDGKIGKIECANGGTLFLDEIGDMPLDLQPVLLRVLEEKRITRVGGRQSIPVDFRIISATNRPLYDDILRKQFRQDLYFRLAVVNLEIPPLREREEDILLMADNFIKDTCAKFNIPLCALSKTVEKILLEYSWPGNIRQLQNAMIYAVTMARERVIHPENLPQDITRTKIGRAHV
jgi:transcriptional regulator with PAS, ATPase and Fis domain